MTLALPATFNSGARPLIMAYIGDDDPHRGDSKATQGLGRIIANIMKGDYIYVDAAMLERSFPKLSGGKDRLAAYAKSRRPDIVIGTWKAITVDTDHDSPFYTVSCLNEGIIGRAPSKKRRSGFVPHHLTQDLLTAEKAEFKKHYPKIEGPLIAVMLGGNHVEIPYDLSKHLTSLASAYPQVTFFFCPCRRSGPLKDDTIRYLRRDLFETEKRFLMDRHTLDGRLKKIFANLAARPPSPGLTGGTSILDVNYDDAIAGYNPYLGLLASADHIIVAGESYSLVSEALFTGKKVYTFHPAHDYTALKRVIDLESIDHTRPLPVYQGKSFDLTGEIATGIVKSYCIDRERRKNATLLEAAP